MRTLLLFFVIALLLCTSVQAQFTTGQAADIVLGQSDFNSATFPGSPSATAMVPSSVAVDSVNNKIFVADGTFNRVLRWSTTSVNTNDAAEAVFGQVNLTANPTPSVFDSTMDYPTGVFLDRGGRLWVADANANRILRFDGASSIVSGSARANGVLGEPDFKTGGGGTTQSTVTYPNAVAVDGAGNLYVADQSNNRVVRFNNAASKSNGALADGVLGQSGFTSSSAGTTSTTMSGPTGVAIDNSGTLYVADQGNNRVLIFLNAVSKGNGAAADGVLGQLDLTSKTTYSTRSAHTLNAPYGVAVDGAGRLYVSDQNSSRILFYASQNSITTNTADSVLGQGSFTAHSANAGAANPFSSSLSGPAGLAIDNTNGKLWVADLNNYRVLRYSASFVPLPVELTSFTASGLSGKVELAWSTATETNNYGFDIERRTINSQQSTVNNWQKIGFVGGHGTISAPQNYSFTDGSARLGKYSYRLKQIDRDGKFEYHQEIEVTLAITPNTVWLDNNYPNPFNPSTKISFVLGTTGRATLKVFNLLGQEVATLADGDFTAGEVQEFNFDASRLASGIYYYQLKSGDRTEIKKMMLLK